MTAHALHRVASDFFDVISLTDEVSGKVPLLLAKHAGFFCNQQLGAAYNALSNNSLGVRQHMALALLYSGMLTVCTTLPMETA